MRVTARQRATLKGRVLDAARELIALGQVPSESRLHWRIPAGGATLLRTLRDELRAEGLLDWSNLAGAPRPSPGPRHPWTGGSRERDYTEAELAAMDRLREEIRAAKAERGEPVPKYPPARVPTVYRLPEWATED